MATTYEQAVEVLNAAKLTSDGQQKVDHLRSLLELVVRKQPDLLPEFMPELAELQVDPSQPVRRFLPELLDGAVAASPCPAVLTPTLGCLRGLVGDAAAATARRALQSCYPAFRAAYAVVALRGGAEVADKAELDALRELWAAACALKLAVAALASGAGDGGAGPAGAAANDGVRQLALRFLEQAVMLLTAEVVPAVPGVSAAPQAAPTANAVASKAAVVRDAEAALAQLVALLRQPLGKQLPPAVAATAVRSAAGIAQQRPQFMGRLLPPLLALANSEALRQAAADGEPAAPAGGPGRGGQQQPVGPAGVAAGLKAALVTLSRSTAPAAQPWKRKLAACLEGLGVGPEVQPAGDGSGGQKRPLAAAPEPNKRQRLDSAQPVVPAQQPAAPALAPAGAPPALQPPLPGFQQLAEASALPQPPVTPPDQLAKVLAVLQALVAARDATTLAGVVGSLQPAVLADVVMAYMPGLPARGSLPPDSAPHEPWVLQLLQLVAAQAPLQLPTAPAPAGGMQQDQQPPQQQQQQQQAAEPVKQDGGTAAAPPAAAVKPSPVVRPSAVALAAAFRLEPMPLTQSQQRALRLAAVLRILRTDKTSRQGLRTSLVAKLAADAELADQAATIMQQLMQGVASSEGEGGPAGELDVALQWLDLLFARECQPQSVSAAADGSDEAGSGPGSDQAAAAAEKQQQQRRQRARPGGRGPGATSGGDGGSVYESTLLQLLRGLQAALPPSSRVIARVLLEAPALPQPAVRRFLEELAGAGPDWCTLALLAARDAILQRPPSRSDLLAMVLDACASPASDTRSKAVRLVANRLFSDAGMASAIEQAARRRLDAMLPAPKPAGDAATAGKAASAGVAAGEAAAAAAGEAGAVAGAAAEPAAGASPQQASPATTAAADAQHASPAAEAAAGTGQEEAAAAEKAGGAAEQQGAAPAVEVKQEPGEAPPLAEPVGEQHGEEPQGPSAVEAAQLCALYCALCTKKHSLLRHLFEVYGATSDGGRTAIQRNAAGLAKTLGAGAPALLAVVADPPAGSLPLVLQMLHVLTEAAVPPPLMVAACLRLHEACKDARVLVPSLRGMDRAAALRLLPALLGLQPEQLRPALQRLVAPLPAPAGDAAQQQPGQAAPPPLPPLAPAVLSPEQLLSALHTLDHSRDPGLLRRMMQGVTVCISSPALFPPEALAACIGQLMTLVPLPQLFMRTVIQTVAAAPRLRAFVVRILRQLVAKQIWKDATQWKGWLMCAQQTAPDSFPALVSLPPDVLGPAVKAMPQATRQQLLGFAEQSGTGVPAVTLQALRQGALPAAENGAA